MSHRGFAALRKASGVFFGFLGLASLIFVFAAIGDLVGGGDGQTSTGILLGLLAFFSGTTAGSGLLAKRLWSGPRFEPEDHESRLLALMRRKGGRVTLPEVSLELGIPTDDAKEALDHLVLNGVADTLVSDSGVLVFSVPGLLSDGEKMDAKGVLDP